MAPAPLLATLAALLLGALSAGCEASDPARDIVRASIETHGGERFERMEATFRFRDARFRVLRDRGTFEYERIRTEVDAGPGGEEALVRDRMTNAGTFREVAGMDVPLDSAQRASLETGVNSVAWFGFLPFRLLDPSIRHRHLGTEELEGERYDVVEVTFAEEGGGADWEDRFVLWFHRDAETLDYLAYRYHRDGGGTRFRRAVNRRTVEGLLVQDYENYRAEPPVEDIAGYARLIGSDRLVPVSLIELEDLAIRVPD